MFGVSLGVLAAIVALANAQSSDPCDPLNHNELNEPHRSTGYQTGYQEKPLCDMHMSAGWYRFTSLAGAQMPTSCPKRLSCGSVVPIWMKGTHPATGDGVVMRTACANFETGGTQTDPCCEHSVTIGVKNCGSFYVYYLRPTPSCPMAYCAGSRAPCPLGKWSPDAFPPCKDAYPLLKTPPTLKGPILPNNKSFHFTCNIDWPTQDPDQRFEVIWTFDDKEDPNVFPQVLSDPQRVAKLDGSKLKGHMNSNVGCKIRSYYEQSGSQSHKSALIKSNVYYAGIQVGPPSLVVSERSFAKNIDITSTIPVVCDHDTECCVIFKLDVDDETDMSIETSCDYSMCTEDWDPITKTAHIQVPVVANQDLIDDGDKQLLLAFEKLLPSGGGPYQEVFTDHTPPKVQVEVEDQHTFHCSITGDPHFHGHDYKPYHLFKVGDFTVYEVPSRDFQVQVRTWPCNGGKVTCICAVSIREKNDIIRVDQCDQAYNQPTTSPTVRTANKLSDATIVQRSADGRHIGVYLPSGSEIKLDTSPKAMNVYITTPGFDKAQARGLCGTNDGSRANEFTHPDGTVDAMCADGDRHCIPNQFMDSWRSSPQNSLFESVPNPVNDTMDITYCKCKDNTFGMPAINCTSRGNVAYRNTACAHCKAITKGLVPSFLVGQGWNKRGAVYQDVDTVTHPYVAKDIPEVRSDSKAWPTASGITEKQAQTKCEGAIHKSPLWSKCNAMGQMVDSIMADCYSDVLFGDSFEFLDEISSHFTAQCQITLALDPSNYVTASNGDVIMKPELLTDVCFPECELHGHCGAHGVCHCNHGWEGEMCHIMSNKGPQLDSIRSGPICDVQSRPCRKVFIDATNLDLSDDLVCRVQAVDARGNPSGKPVTTDAEYLSAGRIACSLPKTDVSNQMYKVSASNDATLFGSEVDIRVFDSSCLDCTTTTCKEKTTACHINNRCYNDGVRNPSDGKHMCDVSNSVSGWTAVPAMASTPTVSGPNVDFLYTCRFDAVKVNGEVKVTWLVDGVERTDDTLAKGTGQAMISVHDLPKTGMLSCRIEFNGLSATSGSLTL